MKKYTVIGFYDDNTHIFSHHIMAVDGYDAFAKIAQEYPHTVLVAALPSWLEEGEGLHFPGTSIIEAQEYTARAVND